MTTPLRKPRSRPPAPPPDAEPDVYPDPASFYENELRWYYQRDLDTADAAWCPEWQTHPEAITRVTALWHAWEHATRNTDDGAAMAKWFANLADPIMRELLNPTGTFKGCKVRSGHRVKGGNGPLP